MSRSAAALQGHRLLAARAAGRQRTNLVYRSGRPVIISEFGIRVRIDGWSNRGGAGAFAPNQTERGRRYQSQIDQFIGFRHILGAVWHAWSDRYMPNNPDVQINMGLVQCDDPIRGFHLGTKWTTLGRSIAETNLNIIDLIEARTGL